MGVGGDCIVRVIVSCDCIGALLNKRVLSGFDLSDAKPCHIESHKMKGFNGNW